MPETIETAGIYFNFPGEDYFADPCPMPSLTQSVTKKLIETSPAHARLAHPRLNENFEPDDPKKYDIGNIAHRILLGRGKGLVVIEGDNWVQDRKIKAERREEALAEGKLGVLSRDFDTGSAMAEAAFRQLAERGFANDWTENAGDAEVVIAWDEDGLWFRSMIDWLPNHRRRIWDYKTTVRSAAPHALRYLPVDGGWGIQAAMHERGLNVLDPATAGRREHLFVVQEASEPYALTVVKIPEGFLTMGRKQLAFAIPRWAQCLRTNEWPAYSLETHIAEYPAYAEQAWLDREVNEGVEPRAPDDDGDEPINYLNAG